MAMALPLTRNLGWLLLSRPGTLAFCSPAPAVRCAGSLAPNPNLAVATARRTMSSSTTSSAPLAAGMSPEEKALRIAGLPFGPHPVGVATVQIDDPTGARPGRGLQTEVWYPAADDARSSPATKYGAYLGLDSADDPAAALRAADAPSAIGGYRSGITIAELDSERTTWLTLARRGAAVRRPEGEGGKWPLVVFSHGAGAYRASYSFWTEFLASHGFVVAAPDHPGSARYTIVDGKVITPANAGFDRAAMERDRPLDLVQVVNGIEGKVNGEILSGLVDTNNVALTGMSFGGYTVAAALEFLDPRVKAAVMMCSSMSKSGTRDYHTPARKNKATPVMCMIGREDTVLGAEANAASLEYVRSHSGADAYHLEIVRGGHVSFTSCEMYDPEYGNGIAKEGRCPTLDGRGTYRPMDIARQHEVANSYGLAFLNKYLKGVETDYLDANHFSLDEVVYLKSGA